MVASSPMASVGTSSPNEMPPSIQIPEAFSQSPILANWTDNDGIEHPGDPLRPMRFSDAPRHPAGSQFQGIPIGGRMERNIGANAGASWVPGHATRNDKIARRFGAAGPNDRQAIQNRKSAMIGAYTMMSPEQAQRLGIPKNLSTNSTLWDQWAAEKHHLGQRETEASWVPGGDKVHEQGRWGGRQWNGLRRRGKDQGLHAGGGIPWGHALL